LEISLIKYFFLIFFSLIFLQHSSKSFALTNTWCSNGKYSAAITPFPKHSSKKCPAYAKIIMNLDDVKEYYFEGLGKEYLCRKIKSGDLFKQHHREDYQALIELIKGKDLGCQQNKTFVEKKAEDEAKIKALAEKLAKEEIAKQLKQKEEARKIALAKKKAEEKAKQKAIAEKKALAKKQAEELAKQKAMAKKKAKEEARKKELAKQKAMAEKKAKEAARKKELAKQKAEEELLKQKVLNEKIAKIREEAQFIIETLKEYVTTDTNKLDILEVSELLENYNSEMQKGWSDTTVEKYEELYEYVQKDNGFVTYSSEKKSKQLAAYNEEIRQLREYLNTSQTRLKEFITKNLGSKNAKEALKLAKETKQILKDFDVTKALSLKNNIATWKAMNGVKEDKEYAFKILNKKVAVKNQSVIKEFTQNKLASNTTKKPKNNNKLRLKPGYVYKKRNSDGSCSKGKKEICLTKKQFKELCNKAVDLTIYGRKMGALMASPNSYQRFLETGGEVSLPKTTYSDDICRVKYYVSGVYRGTSRKDLISAKVTEFVASKKGNILIHNVSIY